MDNSRDFLRAPRFFTAEAMAPDRWSANHPASREWEALYRERWAHEKVVRSTHGVNCTGSCSWLVYVKDGIITWELQATDYPSIGPDMPEYEPRGCPRGASFSWYEYSPTRVRYPYVRAPLLTSWRDALARHSDPVEAWKEIVEDPVRSAAYKSLRGKGGFVRASWDEVLELIAAAHVYTIQHYGPDRIVGFSPIPAMSMASYSAGTRFLSLIGGVILSFYDWYADMPIASPQVFGDQTDVPESADWWNASYLLVWGSRIPVTRTPDAHFFVEARYRGQKVVVISPDYSDHTKFADEWLAALPGTDGALAMAMGHVILREFYRDRTVPHFDRYAKRYTDLPFLVALERRGDAYVAQRFVRQSDLDVKAEQAEWKTVVLDARTGEPAVPHGSIGFRWGEEGIGRWNLDLGDIDPALTLYGLHDELVPLDLPRFDTGATEGGTILRRGVPARRLGSQLVTTVFDLTMAQYGVARAGLPGEWPSSYDDRAPYTPAWQEAITSVPAAAVTRIAREFAQNAERSGGRSMIVMGSGTNHWFHSDETYRTFLSLLLLCGCEGVNGGGWAHYVGQEKVRPLTGWSTLAFALDWVRPPRHQPGTPFWYLATNQWRYERFGPEELASPLGRGAFAGRHFVDLIASAARTGWQPSHPAFDRNPLVLGDEAAASGLDVGDFIVKELQAGRLHFAAEDPDAPENVPRVLTVWRANLLGSSGKGHEYFLKHLLGTHHAVRASESPPDLHPKEVRWREPAPEGKLDLLVTADFRMTATCVFSDVVLPAATWYEKHDLSSTDMHPFVHSFNPAIPPPWETRTDWDIFSGLTKVFSELAGPRLGTRRDVVAAPLAHDSSDELAQPLGQECDWKTGMVQPVPGKTMPHLISVQRDYGAVYDKFRSLGPLVETLGTAAKGVAWAPGDEVAWLRERNGPAKGGVAEGRPALDNEVHACEAILALSGTTNGRLAVKGFRALERRTGRRLADLAADEAHHRITFADTQAQPRSVITSPEWSGIEKAGARRYAPFTINVERDKPWHTLTGRQHFYVDHDWMLELGEGLPAYRPPLDMDRHFGQEGLTEAGGVSVTLRYLTPHSKYSIHSEFLENLLMLTLFRGGPVIWMHPNDAARIEARDNDWVEAFNRNGVVTARACVSHRIPQGVMYMYHAKDRHLETPRSQVSGQPGGTDNSLTRIMIKPSHLIGGYAQLSYGFNYYGPTGSQRDEVASIRKLQGAVVY